MDTTLKTHKPVICILDADKDRCLREEAALDKAIRDKNIAAEGLSNYGICAIARTGLEDDLPVIDVDGHYFIPKNKGQEISYDDLCGFLDMLLRKGIVIQGDAAFDGTI